MAVVNRAALSGHGGILRSHPPLVMTIRVLALDFRNDGWEPNLSRFFAMTFREPNNVSSDFVVSMTAVLMKPLLYKYQVQYPDQLPPPVSKWRTTSPHK
jgi:hypothetical protein